MVHKPISSASHRNGTKKKEIKSQMQQRPENETTLSFRSGSVGSALGGTEIKRRWQNTLKTTRDLSLGGTSSNSGNPYIDGMRKIGLDDISRIRKENRELHQSKNR
jgi:hypothetical protein